MQGECAKSWRYSKEVRGYRTLRDYGSWLLIWLPMILISDIHTLVSPLPHLGKASRSVLCDQYN